MNKHLVRRSIVMLTVCVALVIGLAPTIAGAIVMPGGTSTAQPAGATRGPEFTGPTPDLARIANNLSYRAKSVTVVVSVPRGLGVAEPVTISVGYGNGARVTQYYDSVMGSRLVYNYPEGDQRAHQRDIWVTLSEAKVGGGVWTLSIPWQPMITPLYTVTVSPLTFTMTMSCVVIGDNSLDLWWMNPANGYGAAYFTISQGASITLAEFGGTWSDVSASSNLYRPSDIGYADNDTGASLGVGALTRTTLVPGTTTHVGYPLGNANSGDAQCGAWIDYSITYTLQVYATL